VFEIGRLAGKPACVPGIALVFTSPEIRCVRRERKGFVHFSDDLAPAENEGGGAGGGVSPGARRAVVTLDGDLQNDPAEIPRW
jgi:hypothetical protein